MYTGKYLSLEQSGIIGKSRDYNDYCCLWLTARPIGRVMFSTYNCDIPLAMPCFFLNLFAITCIGLGGCGFRFMIAPAWNFQLRKLVVTWWSMTSSLVGHTGVQPLDFCCSIVSVLVLLCSRPTHLVSSQNLILIFVYWWVASVSSRTQREVCDVKPV